MRHGSPSDKPQQGPGGLSLAHHPGSRRRRIPGRSARPAPARGGKRDAAFRLINGLGIYGGFAGDEDPNTFNLADRDFQANETILSGDLAGNDIPGDPATLTDNSFHVVDGRGANTTAILDGFTITGGNADGSAPFDSGGGLFASSAGPAIANCTLVHNTASTEGGGLFCDSSSIATMPTLAIVPPGTTDPVDAVALTGHDLALPISAVFIRKGLTPTDLQRAGPVSPKNAVPVP